MTPWFSGISGRQRREYESDLRGNEHYLSRSENKAGKKTFIFFILYLQFKYMTFIYSQSFINHITGLFRTNMITNF